MKKRDIIRIITIFTLILISAYVYKRFDLSALEPSLFSERIRSYGKLSSVAYVVILTLLPLLLFPDSIIVIAGGMVFGLFYGTILTSIGSLIGAILSYLIAKYLGRDFVKKFIKKEPVFIKKGMPGFLLILILRLVPLFPFKLVSYSAGLAGIDLVEFSIATFIGSIPGILVYVNLGDKVNEIGSRSFYMAILLLVLITVIFYFVKKKLDQKFGESKDDIDNNTCAQ